MSIDKVIEVVDGLPHMRAKAGRQVYDHVIETRSTQILELGTYHGVSTCYLAAAVRDLGGGRVVTIDQRSGLDLEPNVHDLAERTGLGDIIEPVFAERSFTWELKKMLDQPEVPSFDFIFLDAGHVWDVTGFAFFLVDRLVRPGGWLLFDDLNWSMATSPSLSNTDEAMALPEDERNSKQVRAVFDLLVATDPSYQTRIEGNWGWAHKRRRPRRRLRR